MSRSPSKHHRQHGSFGKSRTEIQQYRSRVKAVLLDNCEQSNLMIAAKIGCGHALVGIVRREMVQRGELPVGHQIITSDGKRRSSVRRSSRQVPTQNAIQNAIQPSGPRSRKASSHSAREGFVSIAEVKRKLIPIVRKLIIQSKTHMAVASLAEVGALAGLIEMQIDIWDGGHDRARESEVNRQLKHLAPNTEKDIDQ